MDLIEYACPVYDTLFTIIFDELYELNEVEDEWERVDWDIVSEDEEMNDHYSWVFSKLKTMIEKTIREDPMTALFG